MPIFIRAMSFTRALLTALPILAVSATVTADGWKVDLSRRSQQVTKSDLSSKPEGESPEPSFLNNLFKSTDPVQELVLLNTEKGFVPSTLRLREGQTYSIHVVNVNEKEKNISFVMDSFSEHHATYYGKMKTFQLSPQKEGIFTFVCPETSASGRVVVYPRSSAGEVRLPASEE